MSHSQAFMKRDDIRGLFPQQLDGQAAWALGRAVVERLQALGEQSPCIAVGHDCRHGNEELSQGLMRGILEAGGHCQNLGLVSTEHVYYACGELAQRFTAGAMITASHNPKEYNGIKFIHRHCVPFSQEDLAYLGTRSDELLDAPSPDGDKLRSSAEYAEAPLDFGQYADHLLALSGLDRRPASPQPLFKVVVLAGNGMGGVAFEPIARRLEAKGLQTILLESDPNGDFPQGVPNPLLPDFMSRLGRLTVAHQAQLGIGFDGDADRAGFVDSTGREIIPSQVLALIAQAKLKRHQGPAVIMRNLCCSQLLADLFGQAPQVTLVETPVGHGRIKLLMRSDLYRTRTLFAGEHSGHYFYPEFSYVDSGVLTSLNMLSLAWELQEHGKTLAEQLAAWQSRYCWSGELNYDLPTREAIFQVLQASVAHFPEAQRFECRLDEECQAQRVFPANGPYQPDRLPAPDVKMVHSQGKDGWWFVLRPSGNEPKLRLNAEGWGTAAKENCQALVQKLDTLIQGLGGRRA